MVFFRLLDSPRHVAFCPANFVADTYMGCPHGCLYCYSPSMRRKGFENAFEEFRHYKSYLTDKQIEKIGHACVGGDVTSLCSKEQKELIVKALKHKFPLRIGSVSEPLGAILEMHNRRTYNVIEKLGEHKYPYIICTKSPLVAQPEYIHLIKSTNGIVQVSLISTDDNLLKSIESGFEGHTPNASARLDAIKKLAGEGIKTTCRIQPLIPRVTEHGMKDLIFALAEVGADHVIVEFMKFPLRHAKGMSLRLKKVLDEYSESGGLLGDDLKKYNNDLYEFYRSFDDSGSSCGYRFFSKKEKARLMPQFAEMVREANKEFNTDMTFGSGDEETQYLNYTKNCCGLDKVPGYSGYATCTIQTMLRIAKEKGIVTLQEMKQHYNPNIAKFEILWKKKEKNGKYWIENRVFKLRAKPTGTPSEVAYVYDENAVPS